ncbi:hypothetical protein T492DRAFT_840818 [Pavlovales sp. CCMP2436]|nr:hypothetical protein T492DRAFT_840818 [Pavlovales sp. CCMP2436]
MEKIQIPQQSNTVTEEEAEESSTSNVAPAPVVKAKRTLSDKQKLNYLKANARRLEILADAKATRVAAALEIKRQSDAITEYEMALKLATEYGFNTNTANALAASRPEEETSSVPPPPLPPLRYQMQPPSRPQMQHI